ncbi:MAG TPA: hypothetical protein VF198_07265 [Vicinamibacterales bacterium]
MTRIRATVLLLAVSGSSACGIGACGSSDAGNGAHLGSWSVARIVAGTPGGEGAVGATAEFGTGDARFGDRTCVQPTYARRWLAPDAFADVYGVTPGALGLPSDGEVALIDVECATGGLEAGRMLVVAPGGQLLAAGDGAFYELTRQ